ncbi:MAG: hypothetical protein ACD_84C00001G0004 [uncultured bacterium]|nr:MAG: hypothetical protein ACD_84C00001G0004 [uncultured bacterium]
MRLSELKPQFIRYEVGIASKHHGRKLDDGTIQWGGFPVDMKRHVDDIADAQGVYFLCPKCFIKNNGPKGTHICEVTFRNKGVLDNQGTHNTNGIPVRWNVTGNDFNDITTTPSVLIQSGCGWHGFITNGEVTII